MATSTTVEVAIYDLSNGLAAAMSAQLGALLNGTRLEMIPHTGVRVFGKEYFFSGGIQALPPHHVASVFPTGAPTRVETIGTTTKTKHDLETYLRSRAADWTPASYDLWRHNCNDFSQLVVKFLVPEASLPSWILTLPADVLATPLGAMLEPALTPLQNQLNEGLRRQGGDLVTPPSSATTTAAAPPPSSSSASSSARDATKTPEEEGEVVSVTVKTMTETGRVVTVAKTGTVGDLRLKADAADARLVFSGKVLKDDSATLLSVGLATSGLTVLVVPNAKKKASSGSPASGGETPRAPSSSEGEPNSQTSLRSAIEAVPTSEVLERLSKICERVVKNPNDEKYRSLKLANESFRRKVASHAGALDILNHAGFVKGDDGVLTLTPSAAAWKPLNDTKRALDAEIRRRASAAAEQRTTASPEGQGVNPNLLFGGLGAGGGLPGGLPGGVDPAAELARLAANPEVLAHAMDRVASDPALARRVSQCGIRVQRPSSR